jgi:CHASE1-domain containing sensor protein
MNFFPVFRMVHKMYLSCLQRQYLLFYVNHFVFIKNRSNSVLLTLFRLFVVIVVFLILVY